MIQVFVEITGQNGQRTMISNVRVAGWQTAHTLLYAYARAEYGDYMKLLKEIDAYGFIVTNEGLNGKTEILRVPTKSTH